MAIYRVETLNEGEPSRKTLGRLEVTIDDLSALRKVVDALVLQEEPRFEFDGGYFTSAEDVRKLSDKELHTLRLVTPSLQVVLSNERAVAIGGHEEVEEVYRRWARSRQSESVALSRKAGLPLLIVPALASAYMVARGLNSLTNPLYTLASSILLFATGVLLFALAFTIALLTDRSSHSYTQIRPFSRDELRKTRLSDRYPRRALYVTSTSVIVASLSLIVAIVALATR